MVGDGVQIFSPLDLVRVLDDAALYNDFVGDIPPHVARAWIAVERIDPDLYERAIRDLADGHPEYVEALPAAMMSALLDAVVTGSSDQTIKRDLDAGVTNVTPASDATVIPMPERSPAQLRVVE